MSPADVRDEWMKKAGPFFPLLLAFPYHSAHGRPIVEATESESANLPIWLVVVGALHGGVLALVAALLMRTPLVPAVTATFLVAAHVFATGAIGERSIVHRAARWVGGRGVGSGHLLAVALFRCALFLGIEPAQWPAALVVLTLANKLAYVASVHPPWKDPSPSDPWQMGLRPVRWAALAGGAALIIAIAAGLWGLLAGAVVVSVAGVIRRSLQSPLLSGAVAEFAVLLLFALVFPATTSPLVVSP